MELYVFDKWLNKIGMIDNFTSLRWVRRYYKTGEFELHVDLTLENIALLARENIIYRKDDSEAGVIEYRNLKKDTEGKEVLVLKGKFITSYLNRRIIWETMVINNTIENAMRILVDANCINPSITDRIIPNFILGNLKELAEMVNYQISYANLEDEIDNLSNISNLGHRLNLDPNLKVLTFEVFKGIDRSVNQSINPRVVFSEEFDNILEQEFTDSLNNFKNLCLIGGIGEGTGRRLITVGNSAGLDRYESFNDQKSLSNEVDSVVMSDTDYNNLLIGKGNETLAESSEIQTFESKVNTSSNLVYKIDYDLGDIVTCISKKWNVTISPRITEIEEVYEEQGQQINPTFGTNIPTLLDKIKQRIK